MLQLEIKSDAPDLEIVQNLVRVYGMKIILDTHTFLWFINDSPELSNSAAELIESDESISFSYCFFVKICISCFYICSSLF